MAHGSAATSPIGGPRRCTTASQGPSARVAKNESVVPWEALTGITSAITTVVLIATVLMARRQVQLLRRSTQLDGLLRILTEMDHPAHVASYRWPSGLAIHSIRIEQSKFYE